MKVSQFFENLEQFTGYFALHLLDVVFFLAIASLVLVVVLEILIFSISFMQLIIEILFVKKKNPKPSANS